VENVIMMFSHAGFSDNAYLYFRIRLLAQTAKDDPAYSYEFPRHTALLQLALQTITSTDSPNNGLQKETTLNDQGSPSTNAVLRHQH